MIASLLAFFNWLAKWVCIFSVVIGCGWIWCAIYLAHFGTHAQIYDRPDVLWISHLTAAEQLGLFCATPFVAALAGGILVGIVLECIIAALLRKVFGHE